MSAEPPLERMRIEANAARSIDAALEAGVLVMRNGGSTTTAEASFNKILIGAHTDNVSTVWRLDFIAAMHASTTSVRAIGPIGVNLSRVSGVAALSRRAAGGGLAASEIDAELQRIACQPSPYNRRLTVLAAAAAGACFSQLLGGDWGSLGAAIVAAGVGQWVRSELQARRLEAAPATLISGVVSSLIACASLRMGLSGVAPATVIASVTYLVPGLPLINGFVDLVSHRHVLVGLERIANAAYLFLVLAIAIAFARTVLP
jgi:uncharacterized membrane protein YjjP (DUF1212 family)